MSASHPPRLTPKDFRILETMLKERSGSNDPLLPLLQRKLATAIVVPTHDMPRDVVTLYSRVRYRIDQEPAVTRIVIHDALHEVMGATVPVSSLRGLALLGLTSGTATTICYFGNATETIHVEAIVYQPEAARLAGKAMDRAEAPQDLQH